VEGYEPSESREVGCPNRTRQGLAISNAAAADAAAAADGDAGDQRAWLHGVSGEITSLPAGFVHSTMLSLGKGVTAGLQRWGAKMQKASQTTRSTDVALTHLSYWTDNGAYYYLYGGHPGNAVCDYMAHGPMDAVIGQLVDSWKALDLPVRSIQLDDWWYGGNN
jgi:hypothetical protein